MLPEELEVGPLCSALTECVTDACFKQSQGEPRNDWISEVPHLRSIAGDTQEAANRGDMRELYKLARRLFTPTPLPGERLKNRALADDDEEGLARWTEHFATLLGGTQVKKITDAANTRLGDK